MASDPDGSEFNDSPNEEIDSEDLFVNLLQRQARLMKATYLISPFGFAVEPSAFAT